MVVDDDERVRKLLEAFLIPMGYQVISAANGEEALKKIAEEYPDLVLLDVMMPGMDGFEVLKELKSNEKTRLIPVVMVTALDDLSARVKALELGADDFLTKPVEVTELRARVKSLLKVKAYHDYMINYQKELEKEVERRTRQLRKAFQRIKVASLETIHRLSRAAEYRDEETGAHIQRMSYYASAVARKLGLSENTVETILYASPMHDIGKIGIPDHILLKPGKLNPEEWEIMKQHTVIGGKILEGSTSGFIKLAEVIALTHHEKWDGTGYPKGLKGREIPLAGRITAIADVFDALTSSRPYRKKPFSPSEAFKMIEEAKGTHFDPRVVEAFLSLQEEILSIREKFLDQENSWLARLKEHFPA